MMKSICESATINYVKIHGRVTKGPLRMGPQMTYCVETNSFDSSLGDLMLMTLLFKQTDTSTERAHGDDYVYVV